MLVSSIILYLIPVLMRGRRARQRRLENYCCEKCNEILKEAAIKKSLKNELKPLCEKYNKKNPAELDKQNITLDTEKPNKCKGSLYYPYKKNSFPKLENFSEKMKGLAIFYKELYKQSENFNIKLIELFDIRFDLSKECIALTLYDKHTNCGVNPYHFHLMIDFEPLINEIKSSDGDSKYEELLDKILNKYNLHIGEIAKLINMKSMDLGMKAYNYYKHYEQTLEYKDLYLELMTKLRIINHLDELDKILEVYPVSSNYTELNVKKNKIIEENKKTIDSFVMKIKELNVCPNIASDIHDIENIVIPVIEDPNLNLTLLYQQNSTEYQKLDNLIDTYDFEFFDNTTNVTYEQRLLIRDENCKPMSKNIFSIFDIITLICVLILVGLLVFIFCVLCMPKNPFRCKKRCKTYDQVHTEEISKI